MSTSSGHTTAGGVVWDHQGNWILGYNIFLGHCTPFEAELLGILDGVLILLNKGYKEASIQSDNLEVIKSLSDEWIEDSGIIVVRRVRRLLHTEGH